MSFDDALRPVHKRLNDFQASGDPDVVLCEAATREAAVLRQAVQDADQRQTAAAWHALGLLAYMRYNEMPRGADQPELALALLMLRPFADTPELIPEPMHAVLGPDAVPAKQAGLTIGLLEYAVGHDDPPVLQAAIDLLTQAADATPAGHPNRREYLSELAAAHGLRFDRTGQLTDVQRAIAFGETALAETPDGEPKQRNRLYNLRASYLARFEHTGDVQDLHRGIEFGEQAIAATPPGHPDRLRFLSNMGQAYQTRFEHLGDAEDLRRAIDASAEAIVGTPEDSPHRTRMMSNLRSAYRARYTVSGQLADLERAIDLGEQVVAAAGMGHPERVRYLMNLGGMYADRFERAGATPDLTRSIELNEQALHEAPRKHVDRPAVLSNLGIKYRNRFERFGDPADLDRAVEVGEQAVASTPADHTSAASRLSMLSVTYMDRYDYAGALADLERCIELGERALAGAPQAHPLRFVYALNLTAGYVQRFGRTRIAADLDRAIELGEVAVGNAGEGHTQRVPAMVNLAAAYAARFHAMARARRRSETADLDRAIELDEQALAETAKDHPDRPGRSALLGRMYQSRFDAGGGFDHLDRAIKLYEEALNATPDDHPDLAATAAGLARAYMSWANMVSRADIDRAKIRSVAARAARAEAASPAHRVLAGLVIGALAMLMEDAETAVDVLDRAVALLPALAPGELDRADQEHRLGSYSGLAAQAISAHLAMSDPRGAVVAAEASRGILLAAQLNSRTELDVLERVAPDLASEFANVRAALNTSTTPNKRQLWAQHNKLVTTIRTHEGLADFLRPLGPAELTRAAAGGTVVLLNLGLTRREAVVITADAEPRAVKLPESQFFDEERWVEQFIESTQSGSSLVNTLRRQRTVGDVLRWLWDSIVAPVLAALPARAEPHRIWWLPVGYLTVFPIHAAGYPGETDTLDRAVSSYVPTLRSLDQARRRSATAARRQLTVALSHTPELPDIPGTAAEASELHDRHPDGPRLSNEDATVERILAGLADCTWAHFACHASADLAAPSRGGLRLYDRMLLLPEISELRLDQAELAYLSACSTARVGLQHANEAIHLASAFQLAGFRHVIASLWPLADGVAAAAARAFYRQLPDRSDANAAAATLRAVTLDLRESYPNRPDLWASLVHSGP